MSVEAVQLPMPEDDHSHEGPAEAGRLHKPFGVEDFLTEIPPTEGREAYGTGMRSLDPSITHMNDKQMDKDTTH